MNKALRTRFIEAREKYLDILSQGPEAIETFYFGSGLESSLQAAIEQRTVDEETLILAHRVATWIEIISGRISDLFKQNDTFAACLQHDIDTIFANLHIDRDSSPSLHLSSDSASNTGELLKTNASDGSAPLPPYIQSAYAWLLQNLHNPYPSRDTKGTFARESGSSLKDIENWFINVRKRIGWNKLRLKYYDNKRSKIVDAATRFFKHTSQPFLVGSYATDIPGIDPMVNHDSEFKSIEDRVRNLYSDKLFETPLATKHDGEVRGLTKAHSHRQQVAKYRRAKDPQHLSAYPSPKHSPERSPAPSPERSPENSAAVPLPVPDTTPATCRKRRNCDRESPELDVEDCRDGRKKRSRLDSYQISRDLAVTSLPSPAASLSDITREKSATPSDQAPSENDCISLPAPLFPVVPSGKRKRRLSDAAGDGPSKRPHNALAVPRLQTVSDPLPLTSPIISELHKTVFGKTISDSIPGPVSVECLDDAQVEVDFYSYNASPDTIQPFWLANPSEPCPTAFSLSSAANSELPSLDKSRSLDPSFDFLFETYLKDLDIPQASTDIPLFPEIPSHDHSTLFSFENMLATQPPQDVPPDSLSYFQIPWDFNDSSPATLPSAEISFSSSLVTSQTNPLQNEKLAKLKQIEALRAQLQSLEAEL